MRRRAVLGLLLLVAVPSPTSAQARDRPPDRVWLGVGLAQGVSAEVESGLGGLAQLTWQRGSRHLALRMLGLADFQGFPDGGSDHGVAEFGALYGRTRASSWGHAALAAGVSLLRLNGCGDGAPEVCSAVGIPVTAEAAIQTAVLGLGLQAYGNVNTRTPYGGLVLFVQLGWMP